MPLLLATTSDDEGVPHLYYNTDGKRTRGGPDVFVDPMRRKMDETDTLRATLANETTKDVVLALLRSRDVLVTGAMYATLAFHAIVFDEAVSLWAVNEMEDGGVEFEPFDLGIFFGVSGIALIITQVLIFPTVVKKLGERCREFLSVFTKTHTRTNTHTRTPHSRR